MLKIATKVQINNWQIVVIDSKRQNSNVIRKEIVLIETVKVEIRVITQKIHISVVRILLAN
jgi:hypothetical protein